MHDFRIPNFGFTVSSEPIVAAILEFQNWGLTQLKYMKNTFYTKHQQKKKQKQKQKQI